METILLVCDQLHTKHDLKELMGSEYTLIEASTYSEVEEILSHQKVDLVLFDYQLQGQGTISLCAQIRSHKRFTYLPIVLLLEEHDGMLAKEALQAGVTNFISRPLTKEALRTGILVAKNYTHTLHDMTVFSLQLKKLAEHDQLTNLYNRSVLYDQGKKEIDKAMRGHLPLSLLMIDIDRFKAVNDSFGHLGGDAVLAQFAALMLKTQRSYDLTARFGGEEFVVLLPNTTFDQAAKVAEKIRSNIAGHPFHFNGQGTIALSVSIGVATLGPKTTRLEDLLQAADHALYLAKNQGRNRVCLSSAA